MLRAEMDEQAVQEMVQEEVEMVVEDEMVLIY